jgi:hypothetical protein
VRNVSCTRSFAASSSRVRDNAKRVTSGSQQMASRSKRPSSREADTVNDNTERCRIVPVRCERTLTDDDSPPRPGTELTGWNQSHTVGLVVVDVFAEGRRAVPRTRDICEAGRRRESRYCETAPRSVHSETAVLSRWGEGGPDRRPDPRIHHRDEDRSTASCASSLSARRVKRRIQSHLTSQQGKRT